MIKNRYFFIFLLSITFISSSKVISPLYGFLSSKQVVEEILETADVKINGDRPWDIQVHNEKFFSRVINDGSLGLGESYMEEWWDCKDLDECIFRLIRSQIKSNKKINWKTLWIYIQAKLINMQNKAKSTKAIQQHYDLGNDLFENMLDSLMTYSCGYWKNVSSLDKAQREKYDLIAKKLKLKPGMKVLDIGCGWGGFAKYVSENYNVSVTGVTLSEEQGTYAQLLCKDLDVDIQIKDYRDIERNQYDRIISIGMFEHVGAKNYKTFMKLVHGWLKDDGTFLLHTIGTNISSVTGDPWLHKYIFPNGQLPSIAQIGNAIEGLFVMEDWHNFSTDYDKTLLAWYNNFNKNWEKIKGNYPYQFYRMWKYYLLSCAGLFRARHIQLWQIVLSKKGVLGGYDSIR